MGSVLEGLEQQVDMLVRFYFSEDGSKGTVGVNNEGGALGAHVGFSVHAFLNPDLIGLDESVRFVGEEREGELVLFDEFLVALGGIDADAQNRGLGFEEIPRVAKGAGLGGAARGVVFGVEIEDQGFARKIREADGSAGAVGAADRDGVEVRSGLTDLELRHGLA